MADPVHALKSAILTHLIGDTALLTLIGGPRLFENAPRGMPRPYVTFTQAISLDWSTASDTGHETSLLLSIWSDEPGLAQGLAIAERIGLLLHDAALSLTGHRLINLRVLSHEVRGPVKEAQQRVTLKLRAVTEQL
jgi:hypothetical protein